MDMAKMMLRHSFVCSKCTRANGLFDLTAYLVHMLTHTNYSVVTSAKKQHTSCSFDAATRTYSCKVCHFRSEMVDAFMEHLRCHLVLLPYTCSKCQQTFETTSLFVQHKKGSFCVITVVCFFFFTRPNETTV